MEEMILHFVAHYGYVGIFGILMFGMIGIPVPDEILIAFVGYLVSLGRMNYLTSLTVASIASFAGMSLSYFIGKRFGLPLLSKYGRYIHMTPDRIERMDLWFHRFGKGVVIFGYFVPGVRHLTSITAGISKWRYRTFSLYALPGAVLWVFTFLTLGKFLGRHWRSFIKSIHHDSILIVVGAILCLIIWRATRKGLVKFRQKAK